MQSRIAFGFFCYSHLSDKKSDIHYTSTQCLHLINSPWFKTDSSGTLSLKYNTSESSTRDTAEIKTTNVEPNCIRFILSSADSIINRTYIINTISNKLQQIRKNYQEGWKRKSPLEIIVRALSDFGTRGRNLLVLIYSCLQFIGSKLVTFWYFIGWFEEVCIPNIQ